MNAEPQVDQIPKHALSELSLDALTEIDRSLAGRGFNSGPIRSLARMLRSVSFASSEPPQNHLVDPDYFQPLERLFHEHHAEGAKTVEELISFVRESASLLETFSGRETDKDEARRLRGFCLALHRELIEELAREDGVVVPDWSPDERSVQASLC
jgi:hypothetical protein